MSADARPRPPERAELTLLAGASALSGVLSYVYVAVGTRSLGVAAFAPVSIVWSIWALGVAVLAFPFQHRMIVLHETGVAAGDVGRDRRRLVLTAVFGSAVLVGALLPFRATLFTDEALVYPLVTGGAVLCSGLLGLLRGDLAGTGRRRAAGAVLTLEQLVRVVVGLLVLLLGAGAGTYALTMVAPFALLVMWSPSSSREPGPPVGAAAPRLHRYLGAVAGGSLLGQLVLSGSPVLLSVIGGAQRDVTALFTTLAVARAPYLLGLGAAIKVMGDLGRLVAERGAPALRTFTVRVAAAVLAALVVVVPVAFLVGPWAIRLVFSGDAALGGAETAAIAAGGLLATGSLVLLLGQIATEHIASILVSRLLGVLVLAVIVLVGAGSPLSRVVVGFLASEVVAFGLLLAAALRGTRSPDRAGAT